MFYGLGKRRAYDRLILIPVWLVLISPLGAAEDGTRGGGPPILTAADMPEPPAVVPASRLVVRTFEEKKGGPLIDEVIVPGRPPKVYRTVAVAVPEPNPAAGVNVLTNVPAFTWCYGCSATSAGMVMGYYDNQGYEDMYTGPTNGGVCPMNNELYWGHTVWPSVTCGECPLVATHIGKDGRIVRGHVEDYWIDYGHPGPDPYIVNGWTEHTHGDCTGDYMGTNQSDVGNSDGSTTFYYYTNGAALCDYTGAEPGNRDGCHGMRLFVESRGYTVVANCSQYIMGYNGNTQGFTFDNFKAEIDAGRPVLIQVSGHTMVGFGYNTSGNTIHIHDTWDNSDHTMTWGGSYAGLQHYGVTYLRLGSPSTPPTALDGAVLTGLNTPVTVTLQATDDGRPNPPGVLSYLIVSLPAHGTLRDPGAGNITTVPYTLVSGGNQVVYAPATGYAGADSFPFKANDGGTPPNGGDSNVAAISITVLERHIYLTEGFEAAFVNGAPPGWTKAFLTGTVDWIRNSGDYRNDGAHGGTYNALLYYAGTGDHQTYLIGPAIDFGAGATDVTLEFWHKQARRPPNQDTLTVVYKTGPNEVWTTLASYTSNITTWTKRTISLPNPSRSYSIGFLGNAKYGYGVCVDDVMVTGTPLYRLVLTKINPMWGDVLITPEPNDANNIRFAEGTEVTLTAVAIEGKSFKEWTLYDPNHPGDENYAVKDANNPITIVMGADRQVEAAFTCGSGVGSLVLLVAVGLVGRLAVRRR